MEPVKDPEDPRLDAYRDLKTQREGREPCIAEGPLLVERLLQSDWEILSILVSDRHAPRFAAELAGFEGVVLLAPEAVVREIVGFHFHRGILAAARRPALPSPRALLGRIGPADVLVLCPEINSPENLGSILRVAGGFGVAAVLLGPSCCDPYSRRALRVSMGSALQVPIGLSVDVAADLRWLQECGVAWWAAVCDADAEPLGERRPEGPTGLVLGTEADGLEPSLAAACDRRVTLAMRNELVDSLNVAVAAGVFLYEITRRR